MFLKRKAQKGQPLMFTDTDTKKARVESDSSDSDKAFPGSLAGDSDAAEHPCLHEYVILLSQAGKGKEKGKRKGKGNGKSSAVKKTVGEKLWIYFAYLVMINTQVLQ